MTSCKEIELKVIPANIARPFVMAHHYSGKVVNNSCLHFGAFADGILHGVMSFGPPMDKAKILPLVEGTPWNGMLELNRLAFDEYLPRNSESHCIAKAIKLIRKNAPQVKWIVSFADGCSCGDGTIYRAANFILTQINPNGTIFITPWGEKVASVTLTANNPNQPVNARICKRLGVEIKFRSMSEWQQLGLKKAPGYMLRYIYFIDPKWRKRLTVPPVPFSRIDELGAGMYKGERVTQAERHEAGVREKLEKRAANSPRKEEK